MKFTWIPRSGVARSLSGLARPRLVSLLALTGATLLTACNENYYDIKNVHIPRTVDAAALPSEPVKTSAPPTAAPTATPFDAGERPDAALPSDADTGTGADASDAAPTTESDTGAADAAADASPPALPLEPGAPVVNATPADQANFDMFGQIGNQYWFVVDPVQVEAMNTGANYGGGGGGGWGDIYQPGEEISNGNYADHLLVTSQTDGTTADYGKVQVRVVGQSTYLPWTVATIPNLKIDSDEFVKKQRVGGFEHFRFNNAEVGNIFREKLTLDLFKKFNYPSLQSQHAWVGSSVWGEDVAIPYIMIESYKRKFCDTWADQLGGGCENMWEGVGDPFSGYGYGQGTGWFNSSDCQLGECETTRMEELLEVIDGVFHDPVDVKSRLADYIDWPSFHKFQCVSWILDIGDDMFQNTNNVVIVERSDGKIQFLPWSVDISLQTWYGPVPLANRRSSLAQLCQSDAECWADTIAACDDAIATFKAADPVKMLEDEYEALADAGMLRPGDDGRYNILHEYMTNRLTEIDVEIEQNRDAPYYTGYYYSCEQRYGYEYVDCGGTCVPKVYCPICGDDSPDGGVSPPAPDSGTDGAAPQPTTIIDAGTVPDAATPVPDAAASASSMDGSTPVADAAGPSGLDGGFNIALPPPMGSYGNVPPMGTSGYYEPPPACWNPPDYYNPYHGPYPYEYPHPMPMAAPAAGVGIK